MTHRTLKSELHHWWPRTLSKHWEDCDGMVSSIQPDGEVRRAPHGNFGGITNAHHMKFGGPWDATFEHVFNQPDSEMDDVISWLLTLETAQADPEGPVLPRILAQPINGDRQHQLARTVASLVARSPRTRSMIRLSVEHVRALLGLPDAKADKTLIAWNQRSLYDAYTKVMETRGRFAVLFSDSTELIFGDGFFHNFPAYAGPIGVAIKCVLPLTPTITVVFMKPKSYPLEPRLVTLRLEVDEIAYLNQTVQVYSKDFLFFRSQRPLLNSSFTVGEHYIYEYHKSEWLDGLIDDLSQYNLRGPGETPSRSQRFINR